MAVIPVDYAQVNLKYAGVGWPNGGEVTFGVKNNDDLSAAEIAAAVISIWSSNLRSMVPDAILLSSVLVKLGPNVDGDFAEVGSGLAGTDDAGDVAPNMAVLVRKVTALGGRKHRGRMFWPVGESVVLDGGAISSTYVTNANENWADAQVALSSANIPMYLLHNDALVAPDLVTALAVQATGATQRRRLRRV